MQTNNQCLKFAVPQTASDSPRVDIGITYTWESDFIPRLLSTLSHSGQGARMRLILVDNASQEGIEPWTNYFEQTLVIRNSERVGYAANLNRILNASTAPFVLLLNTDMYFDPEAQCVTKMLEFMDGHPECGVAGCRLYHANGGYAFPARRFHSLKTIVARRLDVASLLSHEINRHLYLEHSSLDHYECDWLSGCFLMVRREAYEDVGLFDTGFEKYFEDVDYCLRMALAGWRVMFSGQTYGYHLEQRASQKVFSRDAWVHLKSYLRWLAKWGGDPQRHVVADRNREQRRAA